MVEFEELKAPVAEETAKQIAETVAARKKDVTIPAGERARQTEKNNAGTSLPGVTPSLPPGSRK